MSARSWSELAPGVPAMRCASPRGLEGPPGARLTSCRWTVPEQSDNHSRGRVITARDPYAVERARALRTFGAQLRGLRERRGLSQEGFAEVANLHRNEIGVLERGQGEPGLLTFLILADALEVPLCALCDGLPVPTERRARRS